MKIVNYIIGSMLLTLILLNFEYVIEEKFLMREYTITFNTDGGSEIEPITQFYNTELEIPIPSKDGCIFAGWDGYSPKKMPAKDITMTAKWLDISEYFEIDDNVLIKCNRYSDELYLPSYYTENGVKIYITKIKEDAFKFISETINVYYLGTIENWCHITFENAESNPMRYTDKFYMLDEKNNLKLLDEIIIPNTIEEIKDYQFIGNENFKKLVIPDSVKKIGEETFRGCKKLEEVTIGKNIKEIGNDAFLSNINLKNVYYDGTFENWLDIKFENYGATPMNNGKSFFIKNEMGAYKELTKIIIPETINEIGNFQFFSFDKVMSITFGTNVTEVKESAFGELSRLASFNYNGTIEDWCNIVFDNEYSNPMSSLRYFNILNDNNEFVRLTQLEIPNTIERVGNYQFFGFDMLESIDIGTNVTTIGSYVFAGCENLEEIIIPDNVTTIGVGAFSDCQSLTTVKLSNTMTKLEDYIFSGCTALMNIEIPNKIIKIGKEAFEKTENLENVVYKGTLDDWCKIKLESPKANPMYYAETCYFLDTNGDPYEVTEITIPDNVLEIGDYQFCGFDSLEKIVISNSVEKIGDSAFSEISSSLSVIIPINVIKIEDFAFAGCDKIHIFCEAKYKPMTWSYNWISPEAHVTWGYINE